MAIEYCRPTSFTGTGVTNGANAYDADTATYASHSVGTSTTTYSASTSTFSSKAQTWTSATLNIKWSLTTNGDGDVTQWDSSASVEYTLNGGTSWINTGLSSTFLGGPGYTTGGDASAAPYTDGPYTDSISISSSQDPTQVQVRTSVTGHAKTGKVPDFILGSGADVFLYEAWIEGTYTATPTVTSLNGGTSCNIGSAYDIVGTNFTGATSVSINGVSASTFSVTNSTTISVTIPPMYITANITNCSVSVTTSAGTGSANVGNVTKPSVSFSPTISSITQNTTQEFTATISNITPTTAHWYASSGSFSSTTSNPSTWTAPNPPLSDGYSTSLTLWPDANDASGTPVYSISVSVYYPAVATSLSAGGVTYVTNGNSVTLTPTFSGGSGHAYIGTTNGGSQVTAAASSGSGYSATPASNTTTTYYLHVQNAATTNQSTASTSVAVTAVPAASITSFTDTGNSLPASITSGYSATLTGVFSGAGGHAYIGTSNGGSDVTASAVSGSGYAVYPTSNTTYFLHCTNLANDAVSQSLTIYVYAAPDGTLGASTTTPLYGATNTTITPTLYAGSQMWVGTSQGASDVSPSPSSGVPIAVFSTGNGFRTPTTYWLRIINSASPNAGSTADYSVGITPQTPTLTNVTGSSYQTVSTAQTFGGASPSGAYVPTVSWSNSGGGGSWAGAQWTAGATPGGPHTITATLYANGFVTSTTKTFSVTLVAAPSVSSFTASTTTPLRGATNVTITPTFSGGSATIGTTGYGTTDISANATSATPITVQGSGFNTAKTYYLRVTNLAGTTADSSVTITPQTVSVGSVSPANATKSVNSVTAYSASVSGGWLGTLTWSVSGGNGSFTGANYTAPASPGGPHTITATSVDDNSKTATTQVTIVALANISSFTASTTNPLRGATNVTITPTFTGGTATIGTTGAGTSDISANATSGAAIGVQTGGFVTAKTYYLRVTNAAGDYVDSNVTITPQTVSVGAISPANATKTVNSVTNYTCTVTGGFLATKTWTVSAGGGMVAGTGVYTAPASPGGPYTVTATSVDDNTKTNTTQVTVVAAASITSFTASSTNPLYGATNVTITPTFTGGTAAVGTGGNGTTDISANATSGAPISVQGGGFITARTYYLQVTNTAGDSVTATPVTITPQTVSVGAINSNSLTRVQRTHTISLSASISGAANSNVNWSATGGAGTFNPSTTASGATTVWTAPSAKGSYTITATSAGDGSKTSTLALQVVVGGGKRTTCSIS